MRESDIEASLVISLGECGHVTYVVVLRSYKAILDVVSMVKCLSLNY